MDISHTPLGESSSRPVPSGSEYLRAKLNPPLAPSFEVPRTELCEKIFAAGSVKLVLLRAPAGFGKSLLMQQLHQRFQEADLPCAWATLDAAENDVGRFLAVLGAALKDIISGPPGSEAKDRGADAQALGLLDRVAAYPSPFALFLDDFEALQNEAVVGLVLQLIDQLPPGAQILMGSRGVPALGLGRLRAQGRLLEIGPSQLRFSVAEADDLLRKKRLLDLSADDVAKLHKRTEGWAAALWLASVSLEYREQPGRFISSFSGSNAAIVDYLVEDVLARQTPEVRDFLLRTSILTHLCASLCDEVCQRNDSSELLGRLERAHLFLMPLQGEGGWYRYHAMFAETLCSELQRLHPQELPALHHAAARWFHRQGRTIPAIDHALASGEVDYGLSLLKAHAESLLSQGRFRLLARWLDALVAKDLLGPYPMLQIIHAWAVGFSRGPRQAMPIVQRLESQLMQDEEARYHLLAMRAFFTSLMDQIEEGYRLACTALELPASAAFPRAVVETLLANFASHVGRYQQGLRYVDSARSRQPAQGGSFNMAIAAAAEGFIELKQGRLRQATACLRLAAEARKDDSPRPTQGGVWLAQALYEADECEQAERLLSVCVPLIRHVCFPDGLITCHVLLSRIALARGDLDQAFEVLTELGHIGHRERIPRMGVAARLERVRIMLVQGRPGAARSELENCRDTEYCRDTPWEASSTMTLPSHEVETVNVAWARLAIQAGNASQVVDSLGQDVEAAERAQRMRRALTLRLLWAQALYANDQRSRAMRVLAQAVSFAAAEGYVRAFLDEGRGVPNLLRELRTKSWSTVSSSGEAAPEAFLEKVLRGVTEETPAPGAPTGTHITGPMRLVVPLTRKEIQVLKLAAEGLSNYALAQRLFVAETTVRTHLRNIHVKLDVRNRVEAIAVARRLGLID